MSDDQKRARELISLALKTRGLEGLEVGDVEPEISPLELASLAVPLVPHCQNPQSAVKTALETFQAAKRAVEKEEWFEGLRGKARIAEAASSILEERYGPCPIPFRRLAPIAGWVTSSGKNKGKPDWRKAETALSTKFTEESKGPGKAHSRTYSVISIDYVKEHGFGPTELDVLVRHVPAIREHALDLLEDENEKS